MQATLVSHYGHKSAQLVKYIKGLQTELTNSLSGAFTPYALEQIHATIIGLEGCLRKGKIENVNFQDLKQENRYVDPIQLLSYLRSTEIPALEVQIGGYVNSLDYGFLSQDIHPYSRSFSIQRDIAVAMGWPTDRSSAMDDFRRSFNQFNVLHKWHKTDLDIDNDFFFVLGRVNRESTHNDMVVNAEENIRQFMANSDPVTVNVDRSTLSIVCYEDTRLPLNTSRVLAIDDLTFTPDDLLQCYDESYFYCE